MDAFEQLIGKLLEEENYWVRLSVKVELTKEEKRAIGSPSNPRPEIDIVAFDAATRRLYLIEAKSYLDSKGVMYDQVVEVNDKQVGRYKLLTSENYRKVVEHRILEDWKSRGIIPEDTKVTYGLVAGKVYSERKSKERERELEEYFTAREWFLWGPKTIRE